MLRHFRAPAHHYNTLRCICSAQRFIAFCYGSGLLPRLSDAVQSTNNNTKNHSRNRIGEGLGESPANTNGSSSDGGGSSDGGKSSSDGGSSSDWGKPIIHRFKSTQAAGQLQRLRRRKGQMHQTEANLHTVRQERSQLRVQCHQTRGPPFSGLSSQPSQGHETFATSGKEARTQRSLYALPTGFTQTHDVRDDLSSLTQHHRVSLYATAHSSLSRHSAKSSRVHGFYYYSVTAVAHSVQRGVR